VYKCHGHVNIVTYLYVCVETAGFCWPAELLSRKYFKCVAANVLNSSHVGTEP
jgi:hypothetical protein